MSWIDLPDLLVQASPRRLVAHEPALDLAELVQRSLTMAAGLQAGGIRRAGLFFDDATLLAAALLACWRVGACAILPGDVQPATCARLQGETHAWLSDRELPAEATGQIPLNALLSHAPMAPAQLDPHAPGMRILTSGSSGTPKLIDKRWPQLMQEIRALQAQWPAFEGGHGLGGKDRPVTVLGTVSTQHMYGLPFRLLWPLCAGRPIVRAQLAYPEEVQLAVRRYAPCVWIASPAILRRLGGNLDWAALRQGLRGLFSAGGALPGATVRSLNQRLGWLPTEIYGSSETGIVAWRQGETDWQCIAGVAVGLDARRALWVRSPWTNDAREQTADTAQLRAQGGFVLQGRLDRIIKLEEKRIALPRVEHALASQPWVDQAYVDRLTGAGRLTALIALTPAGRHALRNQGRQAVIAALRAHLAPQVEKLAVPRSWRFLHQLPWNAQGKLPRPIFERLAGPRPLCPELEPLPAPDASTRRYVFEVPLDLAHFSGHFTQLPIVPGVMQVGWAFEAARRDLKPDLNFGGMEVLKFQKLLRPGDAAELLLRWDDERAKLHFSLLLAGAACASGRILHRPRHDQP
ncbi:AMP-binding protein [Bordetella sp. FB-8]|uniref:AMP-binding protein n=1 Tax=Bordetella sp. FB-8 TaxID=1159870 RepID=UPI00039AEFE0|nr:AMP-binding protein [Bordetella sp. FB-8]